MSNENKYDFVKKLYDAKDYMMALTQLQTFAIVVGFDDEAFAWAAWCHYRLGNLAEATEVLRQVGGDNQRALLCKAYVLADCRSGSASKAGVHKALEQCTYFVTSARAIVDFVQDPNNIFWRDRDTMLTYAFTLAPYEYEGVEVGHLFRDAARVYVDDPPITSTDFFVALGLLEMALAKYGTADENAHHRAEVLFCKSKVMETIGDVNSALAVAYDSVRMWVVAIQNDPQNKGHKECHVGASGHALRLERLVQQATK